MKILRKILGYCPGYGFGDCQECRKWFKYPKRRRQNTMYENEESNYVTCCAERFEEIEEYWAERWAEYYSSRL